MTAPGSAFDEPASSILLLRHADAGSKKAWIGDDRERPLSTQGRSDAEALGPLLERAVPGRLVTSPLLRCRQTIAPLAARTGVPVEQVDALDPTASDEAASFVRGLERIGATVVVCTHGEVIEALQGRLACASGVKFADDPRRAKGSVWSLRLRDGRVVHAEYHPPPRGNDPSIDDRDQATLAATPTATVRGTDDV